MKGLLKTIVTFTTIIGALAAPAPVAVDLDERTIHVTVSTPAGTIVGKQSLLNTEDFDGIPFAAPPTGNRRLRPPERLTTSFNNFDATGIAPACPQFLADSDDSGLVAKVISTVSRTWLFQKALHISEDCLTVNVIRPKGTKAGDNLPVLFWIYGGGFEVRLSNSEYGSF